MSRNINPGNHKKIAAELFRACLSEEILEADASYKMAYYVWREILTHISLNDACRIFLSFGNKSKKDLNGYNDSQLLLRLYEMEIETGKPSVSALSRQIAKENVAFNRTLPSERKGEMRQINVASIDKHIRRVRKERAGPIGEAAISTGGAKKKQGKKTTSRRGATAKKPKNKRHIA